MDQNSIEVERLIGGILTPVQEIHQQAQDSYFQLFESNPSQLFHCLGQILKSSQQKQARLFAAVILRQQSLPSKDVMTKIDPAIILELKALAMELFQSEPDPIMRRKAIEFAAMFASHLFSHATTPNPADAWPEILQLTLQGASLTEQPIIQASCFDMLSQLGEFAVQVFQGQDQTMMSLFQQALTPETNIDVAIAASNAVLSILVSIHQLHLQFTQPNIPIDEAKVASLQNSITAYSTAVPAVCQVFARALNEQREAKLSELIGWLDQLIGTHPTAFTSCFGALVDLVSSIVKHPDLEPSFSEKSLSLLLSFGNTPAGRALARKTPSYQQSLVTIGFNFLLDIDYTKEWAQDPLYMSQDQDEWPNFHLGLHIMTNLPTILGTKTFITPLLQEVFTRAANQTNWKQQHAALNVLTMLCEHHIKSIPKAAVVPIQTMLTQLANPKVATKANPRVTVAVYIAITAFATKLGQKAGKEILPHVLHFLPPDINQLQQVPPTMVYYASRALAVLVGLLTRTNLTPFIQRVLESIVIELQHPQSVVVNSALSCMSSCALQLGEDFAPYSDSMVSGLCNLLQSCNNEIAQYLTSGTYKSDDTIRKQMDDKHTIRNKSIESISSIAEALGHDNFIKYSSQCMGLITQSQELELKYPTPYMELIFAAFSKIADCLQADFGPYLAPILPGILHAAAAKDFHYRFDLDSESRLSHQDQLLFDQLKDRGFSSINVTRHGQGHQRVAINAAVVQDKIDALEMLGEFAISLKEAFGPFLQQVAAVLLPECVSNQNPRIRWSATTTLPALLECLYHQPGVQQDVVLNFFRDIINAFGLPVWITKELPEGLSHLLQATTACIDAVNQAGVTSLPDDLLQIISNALVEAWNLCLQRRLAIEQEVMVGDEEQVEAKAEALMIENQALDACVALNTQLVTTNRDKYWPFFLQCVEPLFATAVGAENEVNINGNVIKRDPYLNVCGLVGYADAIGNSGALGTPLVPKVFPLFMSGATNVNDIDLRRGAAYGITACHRALPMTEFAQFVPAALETLAKSLQIEYDPPAGEEYDEDLGEDSFYAQDNAMAGLTDIMTRFGCGFHVKSCIHSDQEQANFAAVSHLVNTSYMSQYMAVVLPKLACFHEEEEACSIHHHLATWLQKCPQTVYGPDNGNLPHVVRIIAHVLDLAQEYDIVHDEDLEILKNTWTDLRAKLPREIIEKIVAILDQDIAPMLNF